MLLVKDIILKDNPDIRRIAEEVPIPISKKDLQTLKEMVKYLERSQDEKQCEKYGLTPGVGLAAPQIDVNKRMLAVLVDDGDEEPWRWGIINPVVLATSVQMTYLSGGEGCLSIPGERGVVLRHKKIKFRALFYDYKTKTLEEKTVTLSGYKSIVFQHEFDHLNGVLFTDKVTNNPGDAEPCS